MVIRRMVISDEGGGEDPRKKRLENIKHQIEVTNEALKNASSADPDSDTVFGFKQRLNTLKSQADRLSKSIKDKAERDKEVTPKKGD
jgi:hypothetical protein